MLGCFSGALRQVEQSMLGCSRGTTHPTQGPHEQPHRPAEQARRYALRFDPVVRALRKRRASRFDPDRRAFCRAEHARLLSSRHPIRPPSRTTNRIAQPSMLGSTRPASIRWFEHSGSAGPGAPILTGALL
jgi:hypothetical protein